ncbi:MAG TPA: hypothetical protein VFB13_17250 [Reyranella sp.]|jgi:hypothetical protein|nr:hypothetical protein [Reyranella sp.]
MRSIAGALLAAMTWFAFVATALADNGLERFEREIKPNLELEKFSYASGQPLGASGFVLTDVVAVVPASPATDGKPSTVKIDKVTVEQIDFDRLKKGNDQDMPRFAKVRLEGMTGDDEMFGALAPYGVPKVPVDVTIDYGLDTATKVLSMNKLEINLRGQARLTLAFVLEGISDKSGLEAAKDEGRLRSASLTFGDSGLIAKVLPAVAKEQGNTAGGLVGLALISIAGFAAGQNDNTQKALDAVASFVADWEAPKGPITIGIQPAKTAGLADLAKVMQPNALVEVFGFTASYPGSRAGAAQSPPLPK